MKLVLIEKHAGGHRSTTDCNRINTITELLFEYFSATSPRPRGIESLTILFHMGIIGAPYDSEAAPLRVLGAERAHGMSSDTRGRHTYLTFRRKKEDRLLTPGRSSNLKGAYYINTCTVPAFKFHPGTPLRRRRSFPPSSSQRSCLYAFFYDRRSLVEGSL